MRAVTTYQHSYKPYAAGDGSEPLPPLDRRADRNTGSVRENVDTHPPFIPKIPKDPCKEEGKERPATLMPNARVKIGPFKEESGAVLNRATHISLDPSLGARNPWQSHYSATHTDPTSYGLNRDGHCRGGVQKPLENGYTRSTGCTEFVKEEEPRITMQKIHPTIARSMLLENPRAGEPLYHKNTEIPLPAC